MSFWSSCEAVVRRDVPLAPLTTWGIGGTARWYAEPASLGELIELTTIARQRSLRVYRLGGGSNLLINDGELCGLVLRLGGEGFRGWEADLRRATVRVGAGLPLAEARQRAAAAGLSGLEMFAGIPGTVGGAARMNAGGGAFAFGRLVTAVGVVDAGGRVDRLGPGQLYFSYRHSNLAGLTVTDVELQLRPDDPAAIRERARRAMAEKQARQPLGERSAGCVFRNPKGDSAGRLLDAAGLKGFAQGDAVISEEHANFFLNRGAASFRDMLRLIEIARCAVAERFGVNLELEIQLWV
jgi:UDP-N-acetylmuramate dehydrogenase